MKVIHVDIEDGKLVKVDSEAIEDFKPQEMTDDAVEKIIRDFVPMCEMK